MQCVNTDNNINTNHTKFINTFETILFEPVQYYYNNKGKDIRKTICSGFGALMGISQQDMDTINELISIMHNASLVIDDIQDNSVLRRNKECAHIKYGVPLSLNSAYLTIFKILTNLNQTNPLSETLRSKIINNIYYTHIGQGMDIYYTETQIVPSMEEYYKIIEYKTGMIFITIIDFLNERVTNEMIKMQYDSFLKCVVKLSYFFQIRDDYINVTDPQYWKGKGFCQDFDEKKISYLITYCHEHKLRNYKKIKPLLLKSKNNNKIKIKLLRLFNDNELFTRVYQQLVLLQKEILDIVNLKPIFEQLPFHKFDIANIAPFMITP
jgi:geranylgeranyl diphosphate synthase type 3